jgi:hypothetical protein
MKQALLILSLVLMTATLTSPIWVRWTTIIPRTRIAGRVTGNFAEPPWIGAVVYFGREQSSLNADGKFAFDVRPGVYVLRVCCSQSFDPIRRELEVKDKDLYVELHAEPLLEILGRLIIPEGKQLPSLPSVSARRIYTRVIKTAAFSPDGTFSLFLSRGDWKVNVEDLGPGLTLKSITFGEKEAQEGTITITDQQEPALLEITLQ